ncbi:MAG: hypothetical protein EOM08_07295 [Clostridia bacterium]|nr:hypothetical protein [Clostridia bacterium]
MTADKDNRMGFNPLTSRKGLDGMIRDTSEDAQTTLNTHTPHKTRNTDNTRTKKPGVRGQHGAPLPRINLAVSQENSDYLRIMASATGISVTTFINQIIDDYRAANSARYEKIRKAMEE